MIGQLEQNLSSHWLILTIQISPGLNVNMIGVMTVVSRVGHYMVMGLAGPNQAMIFSDKFASVTRSYWFVYFEISIWTFHLPLKTGLAPLCLCFSQLSSRSAGWCFKPQNQNKFLCF